MTPQTFEQYKNQKLSVEIAKGFLDDFALDARKKIGKVFVWSKIILRKRGVSCGLFQFTLYPLL